MADVMSLLSTTNGDQTELCTNSQSSLNKMEECYALDNKEEFPIDTSSVHSKQKLKLKGNYNKLKYLSEDKQSEYDAMKLKELEFINLRVKTFVSKDLRLMKQRALYCSSRLLDQDCK